MSEDNEKQENMKEKQAEKLAEFIHHGQKRRGGEDYIEHPRRVAKIIKNLGYGENVVCAAWLHDVEDYPHLNIIYSLIDRVFGHKVLDLIILMTYTKGTSYDRYVHYIAKTSSEAMVIKWQDMIDNVTDNPTDRQLDKYRGAVLFVKANGIEVPEILKEKLKIID